MMRAADVALGSQKWPGRTRANHSLIVHVLQRNGAALVASTFDRLVLQPTFECLTLCLCYQKTLPVTYVTLGVQV